MDDNTNRRHFLSLVIGALATGWSFAVAALTGIFVASPLKGNGNAHEAPVGPLDAFSESFSPVRVDVPVEDGWRSTISRRLVYVRVDENGQPHVLSATCSHLGCTVRWKAEADEFECPCHGGRFAPDGSVLSGPPPRGLTTVPADVRDAHVYLRMNT